MASRPDRLQGVAWNSSCILLRADGSRAEMTFFEAAYQATRDQRMHAMRIVCPSADLTCGYDDLLAIACRSKPAVATPVHGHEANAFTLTDGPHQPVPEPIFRGNWTLACRKIWALQRSKRETGFVVSHDTIYNPAWLEANRPKSRVNLPFGLGLGAR